jgi:hypothetical protein
MPSTINANNTTGLVSTADTSGILQLQTNGTTAVTVDASQRAAFVAGTAALPAITTTGDTNTGIFFPAADTIAFAEGGVEAMRLDSAGNLGIGTTSPTEKLQVAGSIRTTSNAANFNVTGGHLDWDGTSGTRISAYVSTGSNIAFYTNASGGNVAERARITSGGDFVVGRTNGTIDSANFGFRTSQEGLTACSRDVNGSSASLQVYGNAGEFRVYGNGNVQNTNNSYGAISDVKLKENIVDATPKLDKLNQVRVVNYNMIGQEKKQIGVIAQELEQIFPSMVDETLDCDSDGNDLGTKTKSVKYSIFVPMLIKAIQEQQALIETLTQRITALEAKP